MKAGLMNEMGAVKEADGSAQPSCPPAFHQVRNAVTRRPG